jgi:hypothetical protein
LAAFEGGSDFTAATSFSTFMTASSLMSVTTTLTFTESFDFFLYIWAFHLM